MEQWYATGKRKMAIARVFLRQGSGEVVVNGKTPREHFFTDINIMKLDTPLELTKNKGKFSVLITVKGGGVSAQAEAARHGIARALVNYDPELRAILKKEGLLRRDERVKERKKYGQKGARARFQFSKR